jgi:hypothetical protein
LRASIDIEEMPFASTGRGVVRFHHAELACLANP